MAKLWLAQDPKADALLEKDPLALMIGMLLDQQIPLEKAFMGPFVLAERTKVKRLNAAKIADHDPEDFGKIFATPPAIHRFPGSMAGKVQALAAAIAIDYDGDASRIWREAKDGKDLQARLLDLPGIGEMKARTILAILHKRLGVDLPGMADVLPKHPTLGDVDSAEALASYQAGKRAHKAELRAQGKRV
jgi:uncharacterized HhH-GPD family protein